MSLHLQPVVLSGFHEFTSSLQSLLSQALEHIKDQESSLTALKLESLSLEGINQTEVGAMSSIFCLCLCMFFFFFFLCLCTWMCALFSI